MTAERDIIRGYASVRTDGFPYDLLVVGAGLFGAVVAREALDRGMRVLVVERRDHIAGNCHTPLVEGIYVHRYGAHIFRTSDRETWDYLSRFCTFNNFVNSPIANYHGELYNLPFNMNTFHELWGVTTPAEAQAMVDSQRVPCEDPKNLEEYVLALVGRDIYEKLVKGYTEKQWGCPCSELPPTLMRRIPLRWRYDNNYFRDRYQGIPLEGYTTAIGRMLDGAEIRLGVDFLADFDGLSGLAPLVVYTGAIDELMGYQFGALGYRGLSFKEELLDLPNYQGVAVMNFTDRETPYTRSIEHKHFAFGEGPVSVVSHEYPVGWRPGNEPFYPMEDSRNLALYQRYAQAASADSRLAKFRFGGRLGEYRYYDMQDTIRSARQKAAEWLG